MNEKKLELASKSIIVITLIVNLIALYFLPNNMGIHMSGGEIDGRISKYIGVLILPAAMTLLYFISKNDISKKIQYTLANVILFIANFSILFVNLK